MTKENLIKKYGLTADALSGKAVDVTHLYIAEKEEEIEVLEARERNELQEEQEQMDEEMPITAEMAQEANARKNSRKGKK